MMQTIRGVEIPDALLADIDINAIIETCDEKAVAIVKGVQQGSHNADFRRISGGMASKNTKPPWVTCAGWSTGRWFAHIDGIVAVDDRGGE